MHHRSSSPSHFPSSPSPSNRARWNYPPPRSSPLALRDDPSTKGFESRRRSQYKARGPLFGAGRVGSSGTGRSISLGEGITSVDVPQNVVREKFRSQCLQRAAKARERAVSRSRFNSGQSSDGFDMECEVETDEDDEAVMQDELFLRIIDDGKRRRNHLYRLSYQDEVGSSFDPDMEDLEAWDFQLHELEQPQSTVDVLELEPNPEELEAYAEEYAAIRDFEDLTEEDLFLSDIEGETDFLAKSKDGAKALREAEHDVDMTC